MRKITIWNKEGVEGDLHPNLQKELEKVISFHEDDGYVNFYIISKMKRFVSFASDMPYEKLRVIVGLGFDLVYCKETKIYSMEYDFGGDSPPD